MLPEDCVPDGSGNPLAKRADFVDYDVSALRGPGEARDRHDGHVRRLVVVFHALRVPRRAAAMVDERNDYWNPMDQYIGGITHAILHLLYARFWTKVMRDMGLVHIDEPFTRLLTQGMVLNHSYFRRTEKGGIDYFAPDAVEVEHDAEGRIVGAHLEGGRQAGRVRRDRHDVEVEAQRRRSAGHDRPLRRRRRAAVRDVRRAPGSDARVVGRRRRRRAPVPQADVGVRQARAAPREVHGGRLRLGNAVGSGESRAPRDPSRAQAGELRLRAHPVQHRGVGGDEDAQCDRGGARRCSKARPRSCAKGRRS